MSKNTKPTRKSGKTKHYSKEEVRKINERYQSMLVKYKDLSDDELNEVLKSNKVSSTDKQAAYDTIRLRFKNEIKEIASTEETPKAAVKAVEEVTDVVVE